MFYPAEGMNIITYKKGHQLVLKDIVYLLMHNRKSIAGKVLVSLLLLLLFTGNYLPEISKISKYSTNI